ncbi:hypothetical protein EDC56_3492 [Sinobacterium caligoides]|uniref:DUF2065 domain-containing protein n=1 Tax=Sinobacterium caligoides TaxID=933926 RepID=A0A3N2DH99_9GAMM|nr:DUF2065 domain-containing protein [Sinobacterium caligoides]ROR98754.1 hypothetical protein EDC56_3492 [Sinobacterium caligoides]
MWVEVLTALSLVLILEGVMPFLMPAQWRVTLLRIAAQRDTTVRWLGLSFMLIGAVLLTIVRG